VTAFISPQTDRQVLISFYRKVQPFGPGWRSIREEAGISAQEAAAYAKQDNIPMAMIGWVSGCSVIWSGLFTVGNFLYGRTGYTLILAGVFLISSIALIAVVKRLWK